MSSDEFKPGPELNKLFKEFKEFLEIKYDIFRLDFIEKFVIFFSSFYSFFIFLVLIPLILLFFSFAAAYYLGELSGSLPVGFMLVGVFYFILTILFLIFRNRIITRPLIRFVSNLFFNKKSD